MDRSEVIHKRGKAARAAAALLLLVAAAVTAGPLVGPVANAFRELPFVHATIAVPLLASFLALYAAGGEAWRRAGEGSGAAAGRLAAAGGAAPPPSTAPPLTAPERRLRILLAVFAVLFALDAAGTVAGALVPGSRDAFARWPFVVCTALGAASIAVLCAWIARDLRPRMALTGPLMAVYVVKPVVGLAYIVFADTDRELPLFHTHVSVLAAQWAWTLIDVAIIAVLPLAARAAWRSRYGLRFLGPGEYRGLIALADVLVAGRDAREEALSPEDVARNVEAYLHGVRAHRVWVYRLALLAAQYRPLLSLQPPLSELDAPARRAFLESRFLDPPRWPPLLKHLTQVVVRIGQQLVFAGYYDDPRSWPSIGYVPFSERVAPVPPKPPVDLAVMAHDDVPDVVEADVCVIGSGAGGAIAAYELAKAGRSVLILEKGGYVAPQEFSEREVEMFSRLYRDGIMQETEDFRFTVLQGECVGGSTTVNNAVCFRPPSHVLDRWNDPAAHDAGLDRDRLAASVAAVERFLDVGPQPEAIANPSFREYLAGATASGLAPGALDAAPVRANIRDCVGCGYCNIGCAYGPKLSMLSHTLPLGQARFGPQALRILADCEVERLRERGGRVIELRARLDGGGNGDRGRPIAVRARDYVLAAGAIASSDLLLRSRVGRGLPVGRGLCFNMGAPLTAEFDRELDSYAGLQISHAGLPLIDAGFVFELWFNPPVAQALNMPGWFERHFENMRAYRRLMAVGVLVGTEGNGRVKRALTGGAAIGYVPTAADLRTLARGLRVLGELLFAAGARRVMMNTWGYDEFHRPDELGRIDALMDPDYVTLGSGHPQGGNAISRDPRKGVVGPDLRVHGVENLAIADASVFPSSLTVNPQLTVMALAHYAAAGLSNGRR